jgi:hypothetical protein
VPRPRASIDAIHLCKVMQLTTPNREVRNGRLWPKKVVTFLVLTFAFSTPFYFLIISAGTITRS